LKDRSSRNSTRPKTERRSLGRRVGDGARSLGEFRDDLVNRPGILPGKAHGWFRSWFAKVWKIRGGGLYACGYAVTFLVLEIRSVAGDVFEADGIVDFFTEQIFESLFRFLGESLTNMISAFMWPVYLVQLNPPWGAIGLGLAFAVFDLVLRKPIERWLEGGSETGQERP
jgi:hypothetical protein